MSETHGNAPAEIRFLYTPVLDPLGGDSGSCDVVCEKILGPRRAALRAFARGPLGRIRSFRSAVRQFLLDNPSEVKG